MFIKGGVICRKFSALRHVWDNPGSYMSSFNNNCINSFHKIFLVYSSGEKLGEGNDYHFYRQDNNGYWSHKPGSTNVTNKDASNNLIKNPSIANRNYFNLNYNKNCFFLCINKSIGHSHSFSINHKKSFFNFNI